MKTKRQTWFMLAIVIVGTLGFAALVTKPAEAYFNCKIVSCACPDCNYGEHLETPPGQCCPICVPD